jgi:hypothetical protein
MLSPVLTPEDRRCCKRCRNDCPLRHLSPCWLGPTTCPGIRSHEPFPAMPSSRTVSFPVVFDPCCRSF